MALEAICKLCAKDRSAVRQLITGKTANICDKCLDICDKKFKALGEPAARLGAPECDFCSEQSGLVFTSDQHDGLWICLCHGCRRLAREIARESQFKPPAARRKNTGTWQVGDPLPSGLDEGTQLRAKLLTNGNSGNADSCLTLMLLSRPFKATTEVVEAAIRDLPNWVGVGYGGPVVQAVLKAAPKNGDVQTQARIWLELNPADAFADRIRLLLGAAKG